MVSSTVGQPLFWGGFLFMKEIKLTQGYVTTVDDEDYEWLSKFHWYSSVGKNGVRAVKAATQANKHKKMSRMILGITDPKIIVDHRDRNPLNNQRKNLRICDKSQNCSNATSSKNSTSKYLGVSWDKSRGKWHAKICKNRLKIHIGRYKTEVDAAVAYNTKALELHGEFANLNRV